MKWRKGPLHYPMPTMCLGKLWCGLCDVAPSFSPSRGWLERPCLLLGSSLIRNLLGSRVVAVLGNWLDRNFNTDRCWRCGKTSFSTSCVGWWRWLSSLELWLAGDARGCQRGLCHGGWTIETRCGCLLKLQRPMPRERRWWIVGKLFMKQFYSLPILFTNVSTCLFILEPLLYFGFISMLCVCVIPHSHCSKFQNIPPQLPFGLLFRCVNL